MNVEQQGLKFLTKWLVSGDRGVSSEALVVWALSGGGGEPAHHPYDQGDLGRCIRAWAEAPPFYRDVMTPKLAEWVRHMNSGSWGDAA